MHQDGAIRTHRRVNGMKDNDLRLDGNAADGSLNEIFRFEMTASEATCGGCGTKKPIGELVLYGHAMGAILRCADWTQC